MSVDAAKKFIETAQSNPALQSEVVGLGQNSAAIIELATKNGYEFTPDELLEAVKTMGLEGDASQELEPGQELTEEQLIAVAGGSSHWKTWTGCACGKKGCHASDCDSYPDCCY
jgi:predicted ribosomally synthesized peptide with nif11-like leader